MTRRLIEVLKKVADYELGGLVYDYLPHLIGGMILAGTLHSSPVAVAKLAVARVLSGADVASASEVR